MSESTKIPEGYRENSRGSLVPEAAIATIDLIRDQLVSEIVGKALKKRDELVQLKAEIFGDIEAFVDLSAEKYGVVRGGAKGNVQLTSYDGKYKVVRANADNIVFDERLLAAKSLIDECMNEWSVGANPALIVLINDAFRTDKKGELRTARILGLRRHEINDPRWKKAMEAISDALQVVGSKTYIRVYERIGKSESYKIVPLDIAGV